ncbi:MAG: hypothetical protein JO197_08305 [Acidobacteria bacterium]|nr:hypothetical protein [Acidobacteriota bacterium]MBV9477632.1 hypothetical protein [Acidobacteriota bacterium]
MSKRLTALRDARAAIDHAKDKHAAARAWLRFQHAADDLLRALPETLSNARCIDSNRADGVSDRCPGVAVFREARRLGADFGYCESDAAYAPGDIGWEKYLELWPAGPDADDAWWYVHVAPPCCDECGPETDADARALYGDFLARFPKSRHRDEALRALRSLK